MLGERKKRSLERERERTSKRYLACEMFKWLCIKVIQPVQSLVPWILEDHRLARRVNLDVDDLGSQIHVIVAGLSQLLVAAEYNDELSVCACLNTSSSYLWTDKKTLILTGRAEKGVRSVLYNGIMQSAKADYIESWEPKVFARDHHQRIHTDVPTNELSRLEVNNHVLLKQPGDVVSAHALLTSAAQRQDKHTRHFPLVACGRGECWSALFLDSCCSERNVPTDTFNLTYLYLIVGESSSVTISDSGLEINGWRVRSADYMTTFIRKSWHCIRQPAAAVRLAWLDCKLTP
uniref:Uncharacterized protein n=1 Tax=Timema cristinae TaxID=61476 RepID=A0A7R9GPW1_TIMCR|nr:unnamed protein product [Timema cristinae]